MHNYFTVEVGNVGVVHANNDERFRGRCIVASMNAQDNSVYSKNSILFCDFHFGGKPKAKCLEVIEPGGGKSSEGQIKVKLLETRGAYKKGEILTINSFQAVPIKQQFTKKGSYFTWVNTNYRWE